VQSIHFPLLRESIEFGNKKFDRQHEEQLLEILINRINRVRDEPMYKGLARTQYLWPHALREALNQMELGGEIRERYKSMLGHYFNGLKNLGYVNKNDQIPIPGSTKVNEAKQLELTI